VHLKHFKSGPAVLALIVLALVCGLRLLDPDWLDRLERMTYDQRVQVARHFPSPVATNLAFVSMDDASIGAIAHGLLGQPYGLYWPRLVYGHVVEELSAQGGRLLLRYSGTEPKARLLVEGRDAAMLKAWSEKICGAIQKQIGV